MLGSLSPWKPSSESLIKKDNSKGIWELDIEDDASLDRISSYIV
jgi:hypothetical protein